MSGEFANIRGVIWDMDGTLLNTLDDITAALNITLRKYGLPEHQPHETLEGIGHGSRYLCEWGSGLHGSDLDKFTAEYRSNAVNLAQPQTRPFEGIVDLLHDLRNRGMRMGIYTNKPQLWTEKLVHRHLGDTLFDMVIGTTAEGLLKPDPEGIFRMCRAWHLDIHEVVMIGDSEVDAETANNAGCPCICMAYGFGRMDMLRRMGVQIVSDAEALKALLFSSKPRTP
jgi:phosphoglycolate phosphatase